MRKIIYTLLIVVLLAACAPQAIAPISTPAPDSPVSSDMTPEGDMPKAPYLPQPEDSALERAPAFLDSADLLIMESFPPQYLLNLSGALPTPCHALRVVVAPLTTENVINVEVYSVVDPSLICAQVLQPFSQGINLGSFPAGKYSVQIKDGPTLEIEAP